MLKSLDWMLSVSAGGFSGYTCPCMCLACHVLFRGQPDTPVCQAPPRPSRPAALNLRLRPCWCSPAWHDLCSCGTVLHAGGSPTHASLLHSPGTPTPTSPGAQDSRTILSPSRTKAPALSQPHLPPPSTRQPSPGPRSPTPNRLGSTPLPSGVGAGGGPSDSPLPSAAAAGHAALGGGAGSPTFALGTGSPTALSLQIPGAGSASLNMSLNLKLGAATSRTPGPLTRSHDFGPGATTGRGRLPSTPAWASRHGAKRLQGHVSYWKLDSI